MTGYSKYSIERKKVNNMMSSMMHVKEEASREKTTKHYLASIDHKPIVPSTDPDANPITSSSLSSLSDGKWINVFCRRLW
mmetsp:Transcript_18001/g.23471  ORF Transcript_18001/g.23471 Transcript_18001/m.23471 type:complete len:80 (+) Transcript_18001:576-815(+)